ncbi:MAG: HEAT repeat domain-containing protein [Planctomycetes bacterium]|nr:HEAT repeat domain-containing protein [Planctomycetota bacterium]
MRISTLKNFFRNPLIMLAVLICIAAIFAVLTKNHSLNWMPSSKDSTSNQTIRTKNNHNSGLSAAKTYSKLSTTQSELINHYRLQIGSADSKQLAKTASTIRKSARQDKNFLDSLCAILIDENEDTPTRQAVAIIIGSIDDPDVTEVLQNTLKNTDNDLLKSYLILALGESKNAQHVDERFEQTTPDYYKTDLGLSVTILGEVATTEISQSIIEHISAQSWEIRESVYLTLGKSLDAGIIRSSFLSSLSTESVVRPKGYLAGFLSSWAAVQSRDSADRRQIFSALFEHSKESGNGSIRFIVKDGFQRMNMTDDELNRIVNLITDQDPNIRMWALSVVQSHYEDFLQERLQNIIDLIRKTASEDPDIKVREYATRALGPLKKDNLVFFLLDSSLKDPHWNIRVAACDALTYYADLVAVRERLESVSKHDQDENVRNAATETLQISAN